MHFDYPLDAAFSEWVVFPDEKEHETPEDSCFDSQYIDEDYYEQCPNMTFMRLIWKYLKREEDKESTWSYQNVTSHV